MTNFSEKKKQFDTHTLSVWGQSTFRATKNKVVRKALGLQRPQPVSSEQSRPLPQSA